MLPCLLTVFVHRLEQGMLKAFFSYSKHQLCLSLSIPTEEGRALLGGHLFPAEAFLTSLVFSLHHSGINQAMRDVVLCQQFNDNLLL